MNTERASEESILSTPNGDELTRSGYGGNFGGFNPEQMNAGHEFNAENYRGKRLFHRLYYRGMKLVEQSMPGNPLINPTTIGIPGRIG
jgi:hypothetical protein